MTPHMVTTAVFEKISTGHFCIALRDYLQKFPSYLEACAQPSGYRSGGTWWPPIPCYFKYDDAQVWSYERKSG